MSTTTKIAHPTNDDNDNDNDIDDTIFFEVFLKQDSSIIAPFAFAFVVVVVVAFCMFSKELN